MTEENKTIEKGSEEWIEVAIQNWKVGSAFLTDNEKGKLISILYERIKNLEGGKK